MIEEWKAIPGYEGLYEVSNMGNVRNVRRNTLLRLQKTNNGYIRVWLYKNGIQTSLRVHRLVAEVFLSNPDNLPQVNHKDEVKSNNCVDNLEWCTAKYNNSYGTINIRRRETLIKNGYSTGLSREEYMKEYNREYREKNKEKIREQNREYYEKNKEKMREQNREYKKKNREKIREQNMEYMREYRKKRKNK